jgi:hypothetical protein
MDHSLTPEEPRWAACIYAVPNLPLVAVGDDIAHLLLSAATEDRFVELLASHARQPQRALGSYGMTR